ncbi:MAG: hypothetical protein IH571_06760, partial [Acholeplasmataceae bacterium]|nr:hypothetical protein [Acholeplasmataceae bacterium]
MKSFVWKLVIAFVFSYVFLMGALVFAYSQISRNFILNKAMESVENVHGGLATRLNAQVLFDYQKIGVMIAEFNALSLDPVEELKSRHHQIMVGTQSYIGFGEMTETGLEINDVTYLFLENFDEDDYAQNVAIYTFDGAFVNQTDSTLYIFFKFGDVVAYFDANTYLENIFDINSSLDPHLIIMSRDNRIFYQSEIADADYYLYNYFYHQGYDATYIQTIVERVNAQESFIINANILSASSFIAFAPLSETFSTRNLYFVSIFNQDDVVSGFSLLNLILLSVFFVVFILFSISLLMLFKILQNKNNDIENARLVHYYAKPYIIRINAKGIIKSYNKSFRNLLGDYDIYDKVGDFQLKDKYEDDTLEDIIRKQKAFTAIFQLGMQSVYIRFITIRAGRGYLLIGDDVTGIEGMFEEYKGLAMYDAITKLPNIN